MFSTPTTDQITQATTALAQIQAALATYDGSPPSPTARDSAVNNTLLPLGVTWASLYYAIVTAELAAILAAADTALAPFLSDAGPFDQRKEQVRNRFPRVLQLRVWAASSVSNVTVYGILRSMVSIFTDATA